MNHDPEDTWTQEPHAQDAYTERDARHLHPSAQHTWIDNHRDYIPAQLADGTAPIPLHGVRICVSVGEGGMPLFNYAFDGTGEMTSFVDLLGLLELVKMDLGQALLASMAGPTPEIGG